MSLHEIPTHLHGADPVVAGCTWSQLLTLGGGAAGAFWTWHAVALPQFAQAALCAAQLLVAAACAFWRPDGHGLLTWLGLVAAYTVTPHRLVWQREVANHTLLAPSLVGSADTSADTGLPRSAPTTQEARGATLPWSWLDRRPATLLRVATGDTPRAGTTRVGSAVTPAGRRGGLLSVLLSQRVLCLSTHHRRIAEQGPWS